MDFTFENVVTWINTPFVHLGDSPVTISGLLSSLVIVIIAYVFSKFLTKLIEPYLREKIKLSGGVTYSILRFVHYGILILGGFIAVQSIGLDLGSLAVIFGFLSVGIGFGLQNVTSNFISGLILLIEQPVAVGDFVNVDGQVGEVMNIKMRSTTVKTLDGVYIVVPNSKFIESVVINWSMEDPRVRLHCPVGVAYGSNVPLVKEALMNVASDHPALLKEPVPQVRFLEFGDSSLNFELLVWIKNPLMADLIKSEINFKIDDAFRENNIQIPFPQRDLHIMSTPIVENLINKKR